MRFCVLKQKAIYIRAEYDLLVYRLILEHSGMSDPDLLPLFATNAGQRDSSL
jgi:hypothetical protein